jgi:hypothetical protein
MIVGQVLIVQFGGPAFQVQAIDIISWLICVGLGFLSLPVGVVIRLIPIDFKLSQPPPSEAEVDLENNWNDAIKQVRSQLRIFQTLRGGRFRAHFGDRKEKHETRSKAFMAAAMLPSLISASVGVQMKEDGKGKPENLDASEKPETSEKTENPDAPEKPEASEKSENPNASEKSENPNASEKSENPNASEKSENQNGANVDKIEVQ